MRDHLRGCIVSWLMVSTVLAMSCALASAQNHDDSVGALPEAPDAAVFGRSVAAQRGPGKTPAETGVRSPAENTEYGKPVERVRAPEHQRAAGVIPAFDRFDVDDAVSLTPRQKMELAIRSAVAPVSFAAALVLAGYHEAANDQAGFGWGASGYGKRAGAAYLDAFDGRMIGNGILPALLHQDPRYFRLGHGPKRQRLTYAMSTTWYCRHDNTGRWEPNYSNVLGKIASGAISNVYYPSRDFGWRRMIGDGMTMTAEGTLGAVFQEFWPDVARKLFHKDRRE